MIHQSWRSVAAVGALGLTLIAGPVQAAAEVSREIQVEQNLDAAQLATDSLERRLGQLERTVAGSAPAQPDAGLAIHGFADVEAVARNKAAATSTLRGARIGTFDLFMAPQLGDRIKALIELGFEYGADRQLAADLERLQLGYALGDSLTLWGGRFHTPFGYWNDAFHHGLQTQTSASRPRFLGFEDGGGILPVHAVGLWATGTSPSLAKLHYDLYVFNGNRISDGVLNYQATGDADGNIGLGFRVAMPIGNSGLVLGLHGLTQRVEGFSANATSQGGSRLVVLGLYGTYDSQMWEVLGEYYAFRNQSIRKEPRRYASTAWYAQAGYRVSDQLTAYFRLERAALNAEDPYFALMESGRSYRQVVAGLRWHVAPKAALKLELAAGKDAGAMGSAATLTVQYALQF